MDEEKQVKTVRPSAKRKSFTELFCEKGEPNQMVYVEDPERQIQNRQGYKPHVKWHHEHYEKLKSFERKVQRTKVFTEKAFGS